MVNEVDNLLIPLIIGKERFYIINIIDVIRTDDRHI